MKRLLVVLGLTAAVAGLVGCDHASKHLAKKSYADGSSSAVVGDLLELRYVENRGLAFSLEQWIPSLPSGRTIAWLRLLILPLILGIWWLHRQERWPLHAAFVLITAGALGNQLEGLARGYVVDFIHLSGWPIFNVADAYLVAGVALLIIALRKTGSTEGDTERVA